MAKSPAASALRPSRDMPVACVTAVCVVADVLAGAVVLAMPASSQSETVEIPARYFLPLAPAVVTAAVVNGRCASLDDTDQHLRDRETTVALVLTISGVAAMILAGHVALGGPGTGVMMVRAYLGMLGLALLSGRVLGWTACWALPLISLFPLAFFPAEDGGE